MLLRSPLRSPLVSPLSNPFSRSGSAPPPPSDEDGPEIDTLSPADGETNVDYDVGELVITFNENVIAQAGKSVFVYVDGVLRDTFAAGDTYYINVTGAEVVIQGFTAFGSLEVVSIQIETGAFKDEAGNDFAGIENNTTWNFTIREFTLPVNTAAPTISDTTPFRGDTLDRGTAGTWTGYPTPSITYFAVRYIDGVEQDIYGPGAHPIADNEVPQSVDNGDLSPAATYVLRETATNLAGSADAQSAQTSALQSAPFELSVVVEANVPIGTDVTTLRTYRGYPAASTGNYDFYVDDVLAQSGTSGAFGTGGLSAGQVVHCICTQTNTHGTSAPATSNDCTITEPE